MSRNSLSPNLLKILGTCLVHLDDISAHSVQYWNSHPYSFQNDRENTWTCSRWLHEPLIVETIPSVLSQPIEDAPAIFSVVGQLATSKPICETNNPHNHSRTCSFWVESRPDPASKSFWQRIPNALEAIARKSSSHGDISNLYDVDKNTGRVSLHIQWASDDVSIWSSLDPSGDDIIEFVRASNLKFPPEAIHILFCIVHGKEVFPDDGWEWDIGTVTYCASLISAGIV